VSGVTAIGQPPLINMMAGKARPLSALFWLFRSSGDMCSCSFALFVQLDLWQLDWLAVIKIYNGKTCVVV
jgi:hypothetical protein